MRKAPTKGNTAAQDRMDVRHLRRDTRTALELAVVALAPLQLVDHLAAAAGLLEALSELPEDSLPALATIPRATARARAALDEWQLWRGEHREKRIARG
jgi:hypothetical protein